MSTKKFIQSKARGTEAEDFVIGVFEKHGYKVVQRAADYFPDFDVAFTNREGQIRTVEIKYDTRAHQTGRFYLDLNALNHSKADILIICYGQPIKALYFLPLDRTRKLAENWPTKIRAGEYQEPAALIPKQLFLEQFKPKIVEI